MVETFNLAVSGASRRRPFFSTWLFFSLRCLYFEVTLGVLLSQS
ncbi:hypothetical protein QFZ96_008448 [Paraburkholderia youngii]